MVRTRLVTGTLASFAGALCLSGIMQAAGPVPDAAQTQTRAEAARGTVADAAQRGDREAVKALLKDGDRRQRGPGRRHDRAALGGDERRRRDGAMLVYAGANVKATTRLGAYTPLFLAARQGKAAAIAGAGEGRRGPEADHRHRHHAADGRRGVRQHGHRAALLEAGADVNAREPPWARTR